MIPAVILSPHLDDAVLSLGRFMAGRPDVIVATVFAGPPPDPEVLTEYDRVSGFASAGEAVAERRGEDVRALQSLRARPVWGSLPDGQYRTQEVNEEDVEREIVRMIGDLHFDTILIPLGIAHPDHRLVRSGAFEVIPWLDAAVSIWFYEELPGRVLWPEEAVELTQSFQGISGMSPFHGFDLGFVGTGSKTAKRRAMAEYRSQRKNLDIVGGWGVSVECPERVWSVKR